MASDDTSPAKFPLSDVIASVKEELLKAQEALRNDGNAIMRFAECEMEFAVEVSSEGKGGVNVWIVELGAGVSRKDSNVVRVKFSALANKPLNYSQEQYGPGPSLDDDEAGE
jgi:hypothetical protein